MQAAKAEERTGERQPPEEVRAPLVVADEQGAALREPRQRALHVFVGAMKKAVTKGV